ncbi:hypothetical protein C8F01DRAFT_1192545 [Mycena amicta]|nr:hypothetical protein C8F01DRAFT_1192545 [Mycena amicta]
MLLDKGRLATALLVWWAPGIYTWEGRTLTRSLRGFSRCTCSLRQVNSWCVVVNPAMRRVGQASVASVLHHRPP